MTDQLMRGKKVLITGAGTGIGRGIALEFAKAGADVVFHYSNSRSGADSAVEQITATGGKAYAIQADFRDAQQARDLPAKAAERMGGLDILVNNAGITMNQPFLNMSIEEYDTIFDVNMRAMFFATQGAAKLMNEGVVINISSNHAFSGLIEHSAYAASKAAITAFTRTLSVELIQRNIRVNCIACGWILVENHRKVLGEQFDFEQAGRGLPAGFVGEPSDVGQLAIFLASDKSRYIVGQTILCDGGVSAVMPCTGDFRAPIKQSWGQGYVPGR